MNLQKLPEVLNRKRRWRVCKRKKAFLLTEGTILSFSFRQWPAFWQLRCFLVSGHHLYVFGRSVGRSLSPSSSSLYRSALCWNIQDPLLNYKLSLIGLWQTSKRKLTLMEARNTKWGQIHTWNDLTYFWHLNWGIQPFQCIQEKLLHSWNVCWTQ